MGGANPKRKLDDSILGEAPRHIDKAVKVNGISAAEVDFAYESLTRAEIKDVLFSVAPFPDVAQAILSKHEEKDLKRKLDDSTSGEAPRHIDMGIEANALRIDKELLFAWQHLTETEITDILSSAATFPDVAKAVRRKYNEKDPKRKLNDFPSTEASSDIHEFIIAKGLRPNTSLLFAWSSVTDAELKDIRSSAATFPDVEQAVLSKYEEKQSYADINPPDFRRALRLIAHEVARKFVDIDSEEEEEDTKFQSTFKVSLIIKDWILGQVHAFSSFNTKKEAIRTLVEASRLIHKKVPKAEHEMTGQEILQECRLWLDETEWAVDDKNSKRRTISPNGVRIMLKGHGAEWSRAW